MRAASITETELDDLIEQYTAAKLVVYGAYLRDGDDPVAAIANHQREDQETLTPHTKGQDHAICEYL